MLFIYGPLIISDISYICNKIQVSTFLGKKCLQNNNLIIFIENALSCTYVHVKYCRLQQPSFSLIILYATRMIVL